MKSVIARLLSDQQAEWISTDSSGAQKLHRSPVSELPADIPITLIVEGEAIPCLRVETPARNNKQLAQAVPYQLEDELASDIDTLHFAYSGLFEGRVTTLIVEKSRMDEWLEAFPGADNVTALFPEYEAIATTPDGWTLLIEKDRITARNGQGCGFSAELDLALQILNQWYEEQVPESLTLWKTKDAPDLTLPFLQASEAQTIQHPLQLFLHDLKSGDAINLRQGAYAAKRKSSDHKSGTWIRVAVLFLVFVLTGFAFKASEYFILKQRLAETNTEIEQAFRTTFPDVERIINPRVQMEQRIKALRSGGAGDPVFLKLLAAFSNEYNPQEQLTIEDIQYRNQYLMIALNAASLQTLEGLKQRISNQAGVTAEISSATNTGGAIEAQIKIQEAS